jgi:putative Holliday junction resolvase
MRNFEVLSKNVMSKVIAIDFGLKRTGLALSDDQKIFAFGLKTVYSKQLMDELKLLVVKEKITEIVIGEPKRLDTSDSHITQNVYLLKTALEKQFPVIAQSGLKKRDKQQKALIDEVSATIILQDYLQNRVVFGD